MKFNLFPFLILTIAFGGLFSANSYGQVFRLDQNQLQTIPNVRSGTATVAFESMEGKEDMPNFLLTTLDSDNGLYRANGQGVWTFHDTLLANPYSFQPSTFTDSANLDLSVTDIPYNADRFNPEDFVYLIGETGGNYYAFGLIHWVDGRDRFSLRIPIAYSMIIDTDNDVVEEVVNFDQEGEITIRLNNTAIPEPTSTSLAAAGLLAYLGLRRRSRS